MGIEIIGTGSAFPERIVTNFELSGFLDTSDEWIRTRTGIGKRHVITHETLGDIAAAACNRALENAGVSAKDIDLIICTTMSADYLTPSLACIVQKKIGALCPAFDLNAACAGFVYGLDTAHAYIESGKAKIILIVSAEAMSRIVDWRDRSTCVLFGDGAGAVVLKKSTNPFFSRITADGNVAPLYAHSVPGNSPYSEGKAEDSFLHMDGHEIYKFAVNSIYNDLTSVFEISGIEPEQIDYVLLHQANLRIIEAAQKKFGIPFEKFAVNISDYGNLSSASIPVLLDELNRSGKLSKGSLLAMCGFGAGFATGACVMRCQ